MKERREAIRRDLHSPTTDEANINQYLKVYNEDNNEFLGHLMDISPTGAMLSSKCRVDENQVLRLRVELPRRILGIDGLYLNCKSLWCKTDVNPQYYRVGFEFTDRPHQLEDIIISLVGKVHQPTSANPK